eukprot:1919232-Alexandrium_andersonii.AAC.1
MGVPRGPRNTRGVSRVRLQRLIPVSFQNVQLQTVPNAQMPSLATLVNCCWLQENLVCAGVG